MIEFTHVTKSYGRGAPAVSDLNLQIPGHKTTVIVGPSGCGKTTTLRMINRMLDPTSGTIEWDGRPLTSYGKTELRRSMGYVIQASGLFPHQTVAANIATVPRLMGWDSKRISRRVGELMELTELPPALAGRYPSELSGGQQQRVGVARGLAADPIVLLMDEPFSAVDPLVRAGLQDLVRGLQRDLDKAIVMITHDLDEAIGMGDMVAIMKQGGIQQVGPPAEILDAPANDFVRGFIGKDRGFRGLGFVPAKRLPLTAVDTTRSPGSATREAPVLVLDERGGPVGWVDARRPGHVLELGSVFDPDVDSLRIALDAALSSPVGRAVAVSGAASRYAGIVTVSDLLAALAAHRDELADERGGADSGATSAGRTSTGESPDAESPQSPESGTEDTA